MDLMTVLKLGLIALFPVVSTDILYILKRKTSFGKLPDIYRQIIAGIVFGITAICATEFGVPVFDGTMTAIINTRDAAAICAGLLFGGPAGIIAGVIGGAERALAVLWGAGSYTVIACSVSTALAGILSAVLHYYMFDGRRPTALFALLTAVVAEAIHMTMVILTHFEDFNTAMTVVKACTGPMIVTNSLSVLAASLTVSLISREIHHGKIRVPFIHQTVEIRLLVCIVVAFMLTTSFVYVLQTNTAELNAKDLIEINLSDVFDNVRGNVDSSLLSTAHSLVAEYSLDETVDLDKLASKYELTEINIVNSSGIITASTDRMYVGFDFANSGEQAAEFMVLTQGVSEYVQEYGNVSYDTGDDSRARKYAAVAYNDGFIQIGLDYDLFSGCVAAEIKTAGSNRHIGEGGFIVTYRMDLKPVSYGKSGWGTDEASSLASLLEEAGEDEMFICTIAGVKYYCCFDKSEGYYVAGLYPYDEAMNTRDSVLYINSFMEILVYAVLFVVIFLIIKAKVVDKVSAVGEKLELITEGQLDEHVDVGGSREFIALSEGINKTVEALKNYIEEAEKRMEDELQYAKKIQHSALPSVFPAFPGIKEFDIYATMDTAREVGGDFYDFYMLDESRLVFLIADVSGKGIPAAMFMMQAKTVLRSLAESGKPLAEVVTIANSKLCDNNEAGMFVTAWMAVLDIKTGHMDFVNAGHNPPLLYRRGKGFDYLHSRPGLVLAGMDGVRYRVNSMELEPGDRLFLYTDGVTEAVNKDDELFGEDRLRAYLNTCTGLGPDQTVHGAKAAVDAFAGERDQFDDITMLTVNYEGTGMITETRVFDAKTEELDNALEFMNGILEANDAGMKPVMQLDVAFEEMFVNVAHYAYKNTEGKVEIEISVLDGMVTVTLRDSGTPFNPLSLEDPDITLSAEDRKIGGLGIFMVRKTMDEVSYRYENGQNIFTMKKKI